MADLGSQLGDVSSRSLHCLHLQLQHGLCKYVRIIPIPALCTELCGLREQYGHVVVELEKRRGDDKTVTQAPYTDGAHVLSGVGEHT